MNQLLPSNSTPLERATAAALTLGLDPSAIRGIADSARCPVDVLPWLAWAMSVEGWEAAETEEQQRALIRESIPVHKRKGTVGAIRRVLKAVGVTADYKEWTQIPGAVPYSFELTAWANDNRAGEGSILSPQLFQRLRALVDATKNERSHYTLLLGARFDNALGVANASQGQVVIRGSQEPLLLQPDTAVQALGVANVVDVCGVSRYSADLQGVPAATEQSFAVANAAQTLIVVRGTMEAVL
ncbi:phage tail protein I [Pseudomonas sp. BC115LW]|uniref:phage tail protein I n=1 Tax=Pseudomonas sp. BC115LW TaxID=2683267 RepID=UPI00141286CE|nr:phage tail protein I [Pseudomonas sp. BC115LW]NBB33785.1 phage tail protein I [Pseudomonas sp. BC115LW]